MSGDASGQHMLDVFEGESVKPFLMVGSRPDGVIRMTVLPSLRRLFREDPVLLDRIVESIGDGLRRMKDSPMDDLEFK